MLQGYLLVYSYPHQINNNNNNNDNNKYNYKRIANQLFDFILYSYNYAKNETE